jgi:hypothetical protein
MYVGSHNLFVFLSFLFSTALKPFASHSTPSAWGRPQNGSKGPEISMNNYELGVVVSCASSFCLSFFTPIPTFTASPPLSFITPLLTAFLTRTVRADSAEELEKKATEMVTYRRPLVPVRHLDSSSSSPSSPSSLLTSLFTVLIYRRSLATGEVLTLVLLSPFTLSRLSSFASCPSPVASSPPSSRGGILLSFVQYACSIRSRLLDGQTLPTLVQLSRFSPPVWTPRGSRDTGRKERD